MPGPVPLLLVVSPAELLLTVTPFSVRVPALKTTPPLPIPPLRVRPEMTTARAAGHRQDITASAAHGQAALPFCSNRGLPAWPFRRLS